MDWLISLICENPWRLFIVGLLLTAAGFIWWRLAEDEAAVRWRRLTFFGVIGAWGLMLLCNFVVETPTEHVTRYLERVGVELDGKPISSVHRLIHPESELLLGLTPQKLESLLKQDRTRVSRIEWGSITAWQDPQDPLVLVAQASGSARVAIARMTEQTSPTIRWELRLRKDERFLEGLAVVKASLSKLDEARVLNAVTGGGR